MTPTTTNDAAELLYDLADQGEPDQWDKRVGLIEAHDADVRRSTVARIREAMPDDWQPVPIIEATDSEVFGYNDALRRVRAILDEEAARV